MKNPMQKLRRFFVRSRTFNASAARATTQAPADDEGDGTRLSGAFIVVLVLHVIAVVGVFAFARIKENRKANSPLGNTTQTAAPKTPPAKPPAAKPPAAKPLVPAAASIVATNSTVTPRTTPKPTNTVQATPTPAEKPPQTTAQKASPTPAKKETSKTYIVKKNETAMKIARDHGCSYEELLKLNSIKDPKKIQSGQVLKLPVKNG